MYRQENEYPISPCSRINGGWGAPFLASFARRPVLSLSKDGALATPARRYRMRAPSSSIQHSSTPGLNPGNGAEEISLPASITAKSSFSPDNSFPTTRFYLTEHRLCSLHLGSFGSPFLWIEGSDFRVISKALGCYWPLATDHWPLLFPLLPQQLLQHSHRPYPHASLPAETEAKTSPPYPASN